MKRSLGVLILSALALAGCHKGAVDQFAGAGRGRYVGVGHYAPGPVWARIAHPDQANDPGRARLADDDQIIVVMDSDTGEVRQCGNLSGVCVAMDPWSRPVAASRLAPVQFAKPADQAGQAAQGGEKTAPGDDKAAAETPPR